MPDEQRLRIGSPDSECWATIGPPDFTHGDDLTFFDVRLEAPGLDARSSLSGDRGVRLGKDPDAPLEDISLAAWLRALGNSRPWSGSVGWRSHADELRFHATCDALGHVSLSIERRPWRWSPPWSATITVSYTLGDLLRLADSVDGWFAT